MSWWKGARVRLRAWFRRDAVERELEEELRWHLDMEAEKHLRRGLSPEAARRQALIAFGGVERYRSEHRDVRGLRRLERLWYDLRYALAALARSRAFTLAAVLTLALGIGVNATAFGLVSALVHRPPPQVGEPGSLYRVRTLLPTVVPGSEGGLRPVPTSHPEYADLRDRTGGLAELAAYSYRNVILGHGAEAREIRALSVSANYFSTLRVRPAAGRFWTGAEDRGAEGVAVLAHGFWRRALGGDPGVIGQTIVLSELPVTVIGVAPRHFRGIDLDEVALWLPLGMETRLTEPDRLEARNITWLRMVGRPEVGASPEVVGAAASEVLREIAREHDTPFTSASVDLVAVVDPFAGAGGASPVPLWLLGVTAVVLLIACANVSNLLLARGSGRRRELAVRAALGASRRRIVQLLLVESLLLALAGGGLGLLLAAGSARLVHLLDVPPLHPFIDARVLAFSFAVALATSLLVGLLPALRASRADVERELKEGAPRASLGRSRTRAGLTVTQIALSIVLLVHAGLFVRSLRNVQLIDAGLGPERLAFVSLRFQRGTPAERVWQVKQAAVEGLRALPGVAGAELASGAPFGPGLGMTRMPPDLLGLPPETELSVVLLDVGPDYFEVVGVPLRAGRPIERSDGPEAPPVVVVNAAMARMMGGEQEALGRCVPTRGECAAIVGVVADSRFFDPVEDPLPAMYRAVAQLPLVLNAPRTRLLVRTEALIDDMAGTIRRGVAALAPDVQFVDIQPMTSLLRPRLQPWRVATIIFTLSGGVAFLLAAIGLYGVMAYLVASRAHEMGVRVALGASPRRLFRLVLGEGARLAVIGAIIGLALAPWTARLLGHRMYGVRPSDPLTYAFVAALMVAVAFAASFTSARRASRVEAGLALKSE